LDRTKHCAEAQLEAAEFSPGASKFCRGERKSSNPTCRGENFDVMQVDRLARRSQYGGEGDAVRNSPALTEEIILP
jgi:hypothetical protein